MSLLRKISRNFGKINARRNTGKKLSQQVARRSRVVLDALEPRVLLTADLESLLMPAEMLHPEWGENVNFELKISNSGTDITSGTAPVLFYLDANSNGTLEVGTDLELTAVPDTMREPDTPTLPLDFNNKAMISGDSIYGVYSLTLPSTGYSDGDHTIFAAVDGTGVGDVNTSNNTSSFVIPVGSTAPTGIELYPRFVDFDALDDLGELKFGSVYPLSIGVHNIGGTATGAPVNVSVFLSPTMTLTNDSVLLTTDGTNPATGTTTGVISGGAMEFVTLNVQMPASNPFGGGEMFILAAVDATGVTAGSLTGGLETEVYESNNYRPVEGELKLVATASTAGVDLGAGFLWFGSNYTETVPNLTWGQTTSIPAVNVGVYNAGDTGATAFDMEVKISPTPDATDTNAVQLVSTTGSAVTAASLEYKYQVLTPASVPAAFGDTTSPTGWAYAYSYVDIGSTNTDINSNNNVSWETKLWMGSFDSTNPDLSPYELSLESWNDQGSFHWGDSVSLLASIANVGVATSGVDQSNPITVNYYLHDSSDLADTTSFTPVLLGSSSLAADLATGAIEEMDVNGLAVAKPGTLSTDTNAKYYVVMSIDGGTAVTTEASTTNNTSAVEIVPYDVSLDLSVSTMAAFGDWTIAPSMHIELFNQGGSELTSGMVDINFYLSSDTSLDTGVDQPVGTYSFNFDASANTLTPYGMSLSADYSLDFSGLSSPADGDYTIFVTVSSPSGISFPTSGMEKAINMPIGDMDAITGMDLAGRSVYVPANTELYWGQDLDLALLTGNLGDTDIAGSFDVQGYLSQDDVIDSSDLAIGSPVTIASGITAGSELISAYNATLPTESQVQAAFGFETADNPGQTYRLIFKLDSASALTEAYEYDNIIRSFPLMINTSATITPTGVDVAGQHLFSPSFIGISSNTLEWGGTLTVYSNFENIGPTDDTTGFTIKYYLSPTATLPADPTSDSSILELTAAETVASLTAGSSTNAVFAARSLTVPAMPANPAGDYYIIARATDVTGDSDTSNNDIVMKYDDGNNILVTVSLPDIKPDVDGYAPEFSSDIYWKFGSQYDLALDIINDTSVPVTGSTVANIYISASEPDLSTLTVNALETDTATYTKLTSDLAVTFASGESESVNDVTVTMPSGGSWTDGTYYLIYAVDVADSVTELSETNNIGYQAINLVADSPLAGTTDIQMLEMELEVDNAGDGYSSLLQLSWNSTYTAAAEHLLYNAGDAITGTFTIDYQLTNDGDYTSGIASLGSDTTVSTTDSLAQLCGEVDIITPASGADGLYFVVAKADSTGAITSELSTDTANNYSRPYPVYVGNWVTGLDLAVFSSNVYSSSGNGSNSYLPGDQIQVDYQVA
ncbi:MAG: hypothetical protein JW745_04630, partial [Sedimentisphaerales bacterium]|nr:hypothetical protein [Sedimentisphaerales bacterium]